VRLSGTASGAGTAANGTVGTTPTLGIAAATAAAAAVFSGRADDAFSSILRPSLNSAPAAVHMAWAGIRPLDGLGGSRAAPGGPGPARRWVGGVPEAVGTAATVVVGRGAPPLVLVVLVVH